jgi:recombination protein RecT
MVDYKGFIELAYRSGEVSSIHADVIYEGDIFEVDLGIVKRHVPWYFRKDAERPDKKGKCVGAFCIVKMRHAEKHEVMDSDQLDSIRSRSQSRDSGPWVTDTDEMRKKTVFRRASKWIPISPDVSAALADDDDILEVEIPKRSISIESLRQTPGIESSPITETFIVTETREIEEEVKG